jgi:hypothetical protein
MPTTTLTYQFTNEGPIALERALFCLECELIFAGTASCPRCTGEAVWPLAEWLHPLRPGEAVSKREERFVNDSQYDMTSHYER